MKRLCFMVLTTCLGWHTLYGQTAARPRPNAELVQQYQLGNHKTKLEVLERLLRAKTPAAHVTFYALLDQAPNSEIISVFAIALALDGSCQVLLDAIEYLDFMFAPYQAEAEKIAGPNPDIESLTPAQKAALDSVQKRANESLKQFVDFRLGMLDTVGTFSELTRKNSECLAIGLKKIFNDAQKNSDINILLLAGFLMLQKEDGFETLMRQIQTEDEQTLAYMVMQWFPQYAVVPSLKLIENPATSSAIRNAAKVMIMGLPDNELVFQMVAEAYRHGRYFPAPRINTAEQMISQASLWWGNLIKSKYRNNAGFANHLGQNELGLAPGQDQIIELLTGIDFKTGLPYLKKLPYQSLSEPAKEWLLHATYPPSSEILGPALLTERYQLFAFLFEQIPPRERVERKLIFTLGKFQENVQERFILDKFSTLTDDEKQTAIYLCSELSPTVRNRIFQQLRPKSSERLRKTMDYYSKIEP